MKVGTRVRVRAGDGETPLGEGTYVGEATVYVIVNEDGSLRSNENAETMPAGIPEERIRRVPNNPKIVLDSGKTVYGCQVWWEPVKPVTKAKPRIEPD